MKDKKKRIQVYYIITFLRHLVGEKGGWLLFLPLSGMWLAHGKRQDARAGSVEHSVSLRIIASQAEKEPVGDVILENIAKTVYIIRKLFVG